MTINKTLPDGGFDTIFSFSSRYSIFNGDNYLTGFGDGERVGIWDQYGDGSGDGNSYAYGFGDGNGRGHGYWGERGSGYGDWNGGGMGFGYGNGEGDYQLW